VDKGEWGYFGSPDTVPTGFNANGWLAQAMGQCYRVTGNERARVVGGKFTRYLRDHADYFGPDGRFIGDVKFFGSEKAKYGGHFHNHTNCLLGMLEYSLATGDRELAEFTRKSYEWARSEKGCGSVVTGFFPEFVGPEYPNSEGCPVADMVALALMLSEGGVGDYWDDADRWLRNIFAEIQLTKAQGENLERLAASQEEGAIPYNATAERVTARNIGAFAGWPSGNEWVHHIGIQHCCTGNGSRTIYYAWEKILKYQDGVLRVNLLLNRASTWADVYSRIPYEGQVDLKIKRPCKRLLIRMPEYVKAKNGSVQCSVNDKARAFTWEGRRIGLEAAQTGDRISVKFPISERTMKDRMGGVDYTLTVKGNTVVAIDPPGKNAPLFQRAHLRQNKTLWRTVNRFVSNERIDW
jgi:hypothetical protein